MCFIIHAAAEQLDRLSQLSHTQCEVTLFSDTRVKHSLLNSDDTHLWNNVSIESVADGKGYDRVQSGVKKVLWLDIDEFMLM